MPGAVDNRILAPQPEIVPYAAAYRNAVEVLTDFGRTVCEQYRVHLAAENCPSKFLISPLEFARFLDEIGSPWVGGCFDTGNALWYGFPEHWIPILGAGSADPPERQPGRSMGAVTPTPLLAGDIDWPAVRGALAATGYDGWLTAEVFPHYRFIRSD